MKGAGLDRVVQRNGDPVERRSIMPHPDVATLLTNHLVPETLQYTDKSISRYAARHFYAASTGISSSLV